MSQAALYLELARKMAAAADRTSDSQIAASFLELAGKWIRLAEAAGSFDENDDLPPREGAEDEPAMSPARAIPDRHREA